MSSTSRERTGSTEGAGRRSQPASARKPPTTLRQLAQQVAQGRKVTCIPPLADESEKIVGYVGGWDPPETGPTANYLLFVPTEKVDKFGEYIVDSFLVPQAGTLVQMHEETTFDDEPAFPVLERRTRKFKNYVIHQVLTSKGSVSES